MRNRKQAANPSPHHSYENSRKKNPTRGPSGLPLNNVSGTLSYLELFTRTQSGASETLLAAGRRTSISLASIPISIAVVSVLFSEVVPVTLPFVASPFVASPFVASPCVAAPFVAAPVARPALSVGRYGIAENALPHQWIPEWSESGRNHLGSRRECSASMPAHPSGSLCSSRCRIRAYTSSATRYQHVQPLQSSLLYRDCVR